MQYPVNQIFAHFPIIFQLAPETLVSWSVTLNYFTFSDECEQLVDRNCYCCGRCCTCYIPWLRKQTFMYRIVSDIMFELFITLCIVLNVLAMAIEHYNMPETLEKVLIYLNYVSIIFIKLSDFLSGLPHCMFNS